MPPPTPGPASKGAKQSISVLEQILGRKSVGVRGRVVRHTDHIVDLDVGRVVQAESPVGGVVQLETPPNPDVVRIDDVEAVRSPRAPVVAVRRHPIVEGTKGFPVVFRVAVERPRAFDCYVVSVRPDLRMMMKMKKTKREGAGRKVGVKRQAVQ